MFLLLTTLIVIISNLLLGFFSYTKNPKSATNKLFLILTLILSLWAVTNYFSIQSKTADDVFFWIKLVLTVTSPMVPVIYLLTRAFPGRTIGISTYKLLLIIIFILVTQILSLSGMVYQGVIITNDGVTPVPAAGIFWYGVNIVGFLFLTLHTLYKKYKVFKGLEKIQLKYLILGVASTFILAAITNFVAVSLFKVTFLVALGPLFTLILVGFISYAIIKHSFLDIGLVVGRTVAYMILLLTLSAAYAGGIFLTSSFFLKEEIRSSQAIIYLVLALFIALTFQPLKQLLEKFSDKLFYRGRYDSNQLLSTLAHIMSVNIELHALTTQILQTLLTEMRISKGAFVLKGENAKYTTISLGFSYQLDTTHSQLIPLLSTHGMITFDELEEGTLKEEMRSLGISIAKVLHVKEDIIGFLILGEKASGEVYSEQDLKVLDILAPEMAVAMQNAESYEKIKKFNVILSEEVKRATQDLQHANFRLKQLDQLKDDFVSVASHELRTPMTAIRSYAWMALNRPDIPLSEKMKKYLSRTLISTERLINLVNDMLNVSRIEAGRIEIRPQVFDILALVNEIVSEVEPKADEKMVRLQVVNTTTAKLFADPDKVHQVLLNLIGNALKFTPTDGTIAISFFTDGKVVEVLVKDSGVGISREDLSKLFRKFERLDNSYVAAATSGGTGLGLYISKSLIELMHGRIWATSEGLGKGTTFAFALPIATKEIMDQAQKFTFKPEGETKSLEPVAL